MSREKLKGELIEVLKPYPLSDTLYDRENVIATSLTTKEAHRSVLNYAKRNNLFVEKLGPTNLIVGHEKYKPVPHLKGSKTPDQVIQEIEVLGHSVVQFSNPKTKAIDAAIAALMNVEQVVPEAIRMQSASEHTICRLQNLRNQLDKATYQKHVS